MKKIHRGEVTVAKEIIYPEKKGNMKLWHQKNLKNLREKEEKNRLLREEKENYVPPEPYKLKQFKNVNSKLYEKTKEWILNEKDLIKIKPKSQLQKIKPKSRPKILSQIQYNQDGYTKVGQGSIYTGKDHNKEPMSMFEKYYAEKIRSKSPELNMNKRSPIEHNEENIYSLQEQPQSQHNISNTNNVNQPLLNENEEEQMKELLRHYNEQLEELNKEESKGKSDELQNSNDNHKEHLKSPTPTIKDAPLILPKIKRNYISENRKMITEHKLQPKQKPKEPVQPPIHKNFGKTPEYLEKYKKEAEMKKEIMKKIQEESKYPKGTKLLSDEERINTLNGLLNTKKDLTNVLEKMPITTRTMAVQNKKMEIENKLEEIEKAIEMFSKKQVFVRVDQ